MAFSTSELYRIKRELGYHTLLVGSLPYIGYTQLFDSVIQQNIAAEVATTATGGGSATTEPTLRTLTLASATGFAAGDRCYIDVDESLEIATLRSLATTTATFLLRGEHSGTVPVSLEGPIPMAREMLRKIDAVRTKMGETYGEGAIRKVDEVEFYGQRERSMFGSLGEQLMYWRDELASVLGVRNAWRAKQGGGGSVSVSVY